MPQSVFAIIQDDVAMWTLGSRPGSVAIDYECGYGISSVVHESESALARNSVTLSAAFRTGISLLIAIYSTKWKLGLLVHLERGLSLNYYDKHIVLDPFVQHPQLCDTVNVAFIYTLRFRSEYLTQIDQVKAVILSVAPEAGFCDIFTESYGDLDDDESDGGTEGESGEVCLDTKNGIVVLEDCYCADQSISLAGRFE